MVIQCGARGGKTTIGPHRLAFLNYQGPKKLAGERTMMMMMITASKGRASYTSEALPALAVSGVQVYTLSTWAQRMRRIQLHRMSSVEVMDETPSSRGGAGGEAQGGQGADCVDPSARSLYSRKFRHLPVLAQCHGCEMLRCHDAHYGVTCNQRSLKTLRSETRRAWCKCDERRSDRGRMT